MIQVLLCEDQPIMRLGLKQVLSAESDIVVVDEVADQAQVLDMARRHPVDLLLLGFTIPTADGVEILRRLRAACPDVRVLVICACGETAYAARALQLGAAGYISKRCSPAELIRAIRKVHRGDFYIDREVAQELARTLVGKEVSDKPLHELLTEREWQIFLSIAEGLRPTAIAKKLHISVKTVSSHRRHVLEKLRLDSNGDIIRYAIRAGLVGG
jgi:DNA-binding NarL/FixJ family response regulator